jgi:hypothetical protein
LSRPNGKAKGKSQKAKPEMQGGGAVVCRRCWLGRSLLLPGQFIPLNAVAVPTIHTINAERSEVHPPWRASPEEILREAQNDRCLQFVVQYSGVSLSLYCLDAIALFVGQGNRILLLKSGNCLSSRYIFIKARINRKPSYTVMVHEMKFSRLRRASSEEILREAQNDRCLQFVVQYSYPFTV